MDYVIRGLPPLRIMPKRVEADCYNTVRLALRRLGSPQVIQLAHTRAGDMLLDETRWLCVDDLDNGLPLLEWAEFEARRNALHEPVPCVLRLYHVHAGLLMGSVLEEARSVLVQRLDGWTPHR